jgi:hypothetical protein
MSAKKKAKPKNTIDMEKLAEEVRTKIRKKVDKEKPANKEVSTIKELPQRACIDCHFLTDRRDETTNIDAALERNYKIFYYSVENDNRERIKETPSSFLYFKNLCCKRGVWMCCNDEEKQHEEVVEEDRSNCNLFYPYTEGMSFGAAKEMQDKKQSNKAESFVKSVAETEESKKHQAKRVSHKKGKLKRGERQPNIPDKELFPFVKKDLKFLTSSKGGGLGGGALAKRIKNDIENKFDDKYGDKAKYKLGTVKNLISKINTGRK